MAEFWNKHWPWISGIGGVLVAVIIGYTASVIWAKERLDNIEKIPVIEQELQVVAGAVQKLLNSSNLAQYWEYWRLWETVGLSPLQHAHWCSIAKEQNLRPCAGTLKK